APESVPGRRTTAAAPSTASARRVSVTATAAATPPSAAMPAAGTASPASAAADFQDRSGGGRARLPQGSSRLPPLLQDGCQARAERGEDPRQDRLEPHRHLREVPHRAVALVEPRIERRQGTRATGPLLELEADRVAHRPQVEDRHLLGDL